MELDKYIPERVQKARESIWFELILSLVIVSAVIGYLYLILFSTSDVLLDNQQAISSIVALSYEMSPIYIKAIIAILSVSFGLSALHSVIYPVSEAYNQGSDKGEIIKTFNSTAPNLFTNTAMPILFGIGIYSISKWVFSAVSIALTPEILGVIVCASLFVGLYTAEFSTYTEKKRSLVTSIMFLLHSDGLQIYESGLKKKLFILGLAFTKEGGISSVRGWSSKVLTRYKNNRKMLVITSSSRDDLDAWCFDANEVSSTCSFCGDFDGKCLRMDGDGFVIGRGGEDTQTFCVCPDCRLDVLKAGVDSGHLDEAMILTNEI